jgi:predicted  nucleic acid-binding Zn-ribbon protein
MSIKEWLATVPDYQQNNLFLQITEVNNDELEVRCLTTNLHVSKKWARHALIHISRVLRPIQYESAFTDVNALLINSTNAVERKPPPPPKIQFMPDPRNAWKQDIPTTINKVDKKSNSKRKNTTSTNDLDNDNNTTTTVNTQSSYTQDTISELQNNSYQHQQLLDTHTRRIEDITNTISSTPHYQQIVNDHTVRLDSMDSNNLSLNQRLNTIDEQVQEQLSTLTSNLATLEEEQQVQQRQQEQMRRDIDLYSTQVPTLMENMEKQQQQLIKYFRRQNKINAQTNNEIIKQRKTQSTHQEMIATLQALVLSIQNSTPSTPHSQQRIRKRIKQRTPNESLAQEDSDMESDTPPDELHQIHAIMLNNLGCPQRSTWIR